MKMKLPLLSKAAEGADSWRWPSCGNPKTLSFRAAAAAGDILKTMNAAFIDTPEPWSALSYSGRFPEATAEGAESVEAVIAGLRTAERLFFEPGETSSILGEAKSRGSSLQRSVAVAVESCDPFGDFKRSMEEMVEAHGLKDWEGLEELLSCYLRVNCESNHGYIVGAFVDLLVGLGFASSSSSSSSSSSENEQCSSSTGARSPKSPLSFCSSTCSVSPCLSSLEAGEELEKMVDDNASSSNA
ncbi:hypothetical protein NMG60_11001530 [Bertholletia excelsa]